MSAPDCPMWCDSNHAPAWPVHNHHIVNIDAGRVELCVAITRHDNVDGRTVVALAAHEGDNMTIYDLAPAAARTLATALSIATGLAEAGA